MSTIVIRHLSNSSLAGQTREFSQSTIRLGRRPENDVVFNPELDRTVSGNHCQIVADAGTLYLEDTGSTNGTFVNGQRVSGRVAIGERDQIVLGERGPVLAASLKPADATGPSTIMGQVGDGAMGVLDAGADVAAGGVKAPPVVVGAHAQAAQGLSIAPATPAHPPARPPSRMSQGMKSSIGMNTLMSELDKATSRERKRIFVLAVPVLVLLIGGLGAAWYFTKPGPAQVIVQPAPTQPAMTMPTLPPEWASVLSPRKGAIYLVVLQRPGLEERGVGTAWSCAKGKLATNAHVAAAFFDKPENATLVARSNTNPPVDLKITGATLHPGYKTFETLIRTHPPVDLESGKPIVVAMPFDTALMDVAEPDIAKQAAPLELADDAAHAKVVETTELAYIGFPMEASVESGVNLKAPVAHQFLGNLTRKTDIFLAATTEERSTFLQYTLVVQGGASGSPVFNRDGKVVGLISGNDHFFSESGRIAITGKSFGPRSDAIRALLDNTAEAKTAPYAVEWRKHFRGIYDKALAKGLYDKRKFQPAFGAFEVLGIIRSNAGGNNPAPPFNPRTADKKKTWTIDLEDVGDAAGKTITTFPFTQGEAGIYCVVVWTDNPDVLPHITLPTLESNYQQLPPVPLKIFQNKLGRGTPFVASWAIPRNVGDTYQFRVSGIANGETKKAKLTATLMKAVE